MTHGLCVATSQLWARVPIRSLKKRNIKWKYSTVVQVLEICCIWINPLRCNIFSRRSTIIPESSTTATSAWHWCNDSWGLGGTGKVSLNLGGFPMLEEVMKEKPQCCSVSSMCVCSCIFHGTMILKYVWTDPSPTGQLQGPSSPHEPTWRTTQTYMHKHTHTHSMAPWPYADECLSFSDHKSHSRVIQSEWGQTKQERKRSRESGDKTERGRKKMELRV